MDKVNALISLHLRIPDPENLSPDDWALSWSKIKWLAAEGNIKANI